jgi:diguanylate cyclase (GGDEF)-like protein
MSRTARGRRRATLLVVIIVAVGLATSLLGAAAWRSSARENQRQAFAASATDVSETAETLLRRDTDFVATLHTVLTLNPNLSQHQLDEWYAELEGFQRQVGGLGTTIVAAVPAARLGSFLARRNGEPSFQSLVGKVVPVPLDGRSRYCLISISESAVGPLSGALGQMLQGDWCQRSSPIGSARAGLQQTATDTGELVSTPSVIAGRRTLNFEQAYYRHGATLGTAAQRRAAVEGWVASSFDATALLGSALGGYHGLSVGLYKPGTGKRSVPMALAGPAAAGGFTKTTIVNVEGPWRLTVRGSVPLPGLSVARQTALALAVGVILTVLLGILAYVLMRSRDHALGMVREKTGQLRHLAMHDPLTGLPNRTLALDRAEQMLARARRQDIPVAAIYLDLDGFKHVNDTFGHAAGDELLRIVADRLRGVIRESDTAARLSGDEFLMLVEGSSLDAGAELVADRILDVLRQPYEPQGAITRRLTLTASLGVAMGVRASADELVRDADLALYDAKAAGRNRYSLFESIMQTTSQDRLTLEMDLAEALEDEELFLLYQPTFDLKTEAVTGVEALLRWEHPSRGTIQPDVFIPIAEESGLIIPIGRWVLQEACRQAASWHAAGHRLGVAVNVSARQLESDELIDDVRGALEDSQIEPETLTIEITETTIMRDATATAERLKALKRLGVRIAIDDFGTGYSSLAYLRQFPADALKIDRSFISEIASSPQSTALIQTLVHLGQTLNLETLAEGIEEQAQLETLQREQCDHGQGFLFSRPLDVEALEKFLGIAQHGVPASAR